MATYYARKAGNINATDVWATTPSGTAGAQTFVAGDVLVSNGFVVTVNVSTDLGSTGEVRNDTTGGATAGGSFSLSNGVTLTANVFAGTGGTCVTTAGSVSATIVGNITAGTSGGSIGVNHNSTGTLTVTGSVTGGASGSGDVNYGLQNANATGSVTITGNITAQASSGVNSSGNGTITITGDVTGGSAVASFGVRVVSAAAVTITGTVAAATGAGVWTNGASTINIVGTAVGGSGAAGARNTSTGTMNVTRAKGGPLSNSLAGVEGSTAGGVTTVEEIEYGDLGISPTSLGPIRLSDKTSNVAVMYRFNTTKKNLVDANASGLMPAASNVRSGTVYNGGNSTGTCAVPAASSVAFGVAVDNTTGTAVLTPAAVWDYLTSSATTAGSMGERLKNAATVASTGQALADALTP